VWVFFVGSPLKGKKGGVKPKRIVVIE
jgi:hypothetical protein